MFLIKINKSSTQGPVQNILNVKGKYPDETGHFAIHDVHFCMNFLGQSNGVLYIVSALVVVLVLLVIFNFAA